MLIHRGALYRHMDWRIEGKDRYEDTCHVQSNKNVASYSDIEKGLIGSCNVGNNTGNFISTTKNHIAWIFG